MTKFYPQWQPALMEAFAEPDNEELQNKLFIAEEAIVKRLIELKSGSDDPEERSSIEEAQIALRSLAEQKLGYPALKNRE